jgi:hypothetical protein
MHFLPRAVLKWIQELNLTYSVKNPSRDLASGYTIAEMVSRYFPGEVSMHSFDPGISLHVRQDNWAQLAKIFPKVGVSTIPPTLIEDIIYHKEGAAVKAMVELFSALTSRERPDIITSESGSVPRYAQPTASYKVKDPGIERTVDQDERRMKAIGTIHDHESQARRDRPSSMESRRRNRSNKRTTELHPILKDETGASVEVKHIEIKAFGNTGSTPKPMDEVVNKDSLSIAAFINEAFTQLRFNNKTYEDSFRVLTDETQLPAEESSIFLDKIESSLPDILCSLSSRPTDLYLISRVFELLSGNKDRIEKISGRIRSYMHAEFPSSAYRLMTDLFDLK